MGLSQPRTIFGVHEITPFNRVTKVPYGTARVLQGSKFENTGDTIKLLGGSNRAPWQVEDGDIEYKLSFSISEYPNWLFELFGGASPTQGTPEAAGFVSPISNVKGTSIVAATGLLSTITTALAADLKTGTYVLKATAVDALTLYCLSDIDFGRGTVKDYISDDLSIGTWVDIDSGETSAASIPGFGFTLTAGASATNFTVGDTATFTVRAVNTFNRQISGGGLSDVFPEFGATAYAQKSGSGAVFELTIYKLKAIGITIGSERKQFSTSEYSAEASYDSVVGKVWTAVEVE